MLYAIAACVFVVVFLLCYIFVLAGAQYSLTAKLRRIGVSPQGAYDDEKLEQPLYERIFGPPLTTLAAFILYIMPQNGRARAEKKLAAAGRFGKSDTDRFLVYWGALTLAGTIGAPVLVLLMKGGAFWALLAACGGYIVCYLTPLTILDSQARKRKAAIQRLLPEVLDLLTVSVEAGLSFSGALAKVTEKMKGPLVDELARMLQEMQVGVSRSAALKELAKRCDLQDVSLFTAALIQADQLGVSIADILRIQSDNIRDRHKQRIREAALKAPIKILFPLVFFIFPVMFVVILGPALIIIMNMSK